MKKALPVLILVLAAVFVFVGKVSAKPQIPEVDGVYNDPDHPNIKVRVFVHKQKPTNPGKPGKPTPEPTPVPQCIPTSSDPDSSSVDGLTGWKLPQNWTYNLNVDSVPSSVGGANLPQIAQLAFSEWAGPSAINFIQGTNTTANKQAYDGQNIVAWGRTSGSALAVTYTRYYSSTGEVVDVDTIMNKKFAWSWSGTNSCAYENSYDSQDILTHELGHWLGMDDEYASNFQDNTMYGYGSKQEVKKNTLTTGDYTAAFNLYQ